MKVWTCNTFAGHWPVGTAAVIVAPTELEALHLLDEAIQAQGLKPLREHDKLVELSTDSQRVSILCNGDY